MAVSELSGGGLKQRLVGGIALLVIGMIAWFWLLSADSPVDPVAQATQIPAAPDIKPFDVQEPARPADIAPIDSEREAPPALRADISANKPTPVEQPVGAGSVVEHASVAAGKSAAATKVQAEKVASEKASVEKSQPEKKSATTIAEKASAAKPKENFEIDQRGLPVSWAVQVGLFSNQASADKIKAELQAKGFKAYTEAYKTSSAPAGVKVFVGPKLSRERADEEKHAIDSALKVNSMVVRFQAPPHN